MLPKISDRGHGNNVFRRFRHLLIFNHLLIPFPFIFLRKLYTYNFMSLIPHCGSQILYFNVIPGIYGTMLNNVHMVTLLRTFICG